MIERVDEAIYLETIINREGLPHKEIRHSMEKSKKVLECLNAIFLSLKK